jgi:hypothetical protein
MRWTANDDLATFNQIDAGLTRVDMDITAASQDRSGAALHDFNVQRTLHGDGVALDGADRIVRRLIGPTGSC